MLTQYKSSVNGRNQVSFSEFCDEILNAKDRTAYQIEAIKKLLLVLKFKTLDREEMPKKYENNCNSAEYSKFPFKL